MRCCGDFRRRRFSRANRPDRFVSYQNTGEFFTGQRAEARFKLHVADSFGVPRFSLRKALADAHDRNQPRSQRRFRFLCHRFVCITEKLAAL